MSGHKWQRTIEGVDACTRDGCTVRQSASGDYWQRKKGGHWRRAYPSYGKPEPIPPCTGKDAALGASNPLNHPCRCGHRSGLHSSPSQKACHSGLACKCMRYVPAPEARAVLPDPSPLEVVRAQLTDALNWLRSVDTSETGQGLAHRGLSALATLEESIRADEREQCITAAHIATCGKSNCEHDYCRGARAVAGVIANRT